VLTREEILAKTRGEETVELKSGGSVRVRGLSRNEALAVQECEGTAARDNLMISLGMIEPKLSVEDVAAWADAGSAGDAADVGETIGQLSGFREGAGKSGVSRSRRKR
jgi:hypothetical protein